MQVLCHYYDTVKTIPDVPLLHYQRVVILIVLIEVRYHAYRKLVRFSPRNL